MNAKADMRTKGIYQDLSCLPDHSWGLMLIGTTEHENSLEILRSLGSTFVLMNVLCAPGQVV